MKIVLLNLFFLFTLGINAQFNAEFCGTIFSEDQSFEREDFQLFKQYFFQTQFTRKQQIVYLPININIIRHTDQSGGFDPNLVESTLDTVNARYLPTGIQFEICGGLNFIDKDILYDFDRGLYLDSLINYNREGVINVYYINKVVDDASIFCGFASFPWRDDEYVVVKNSCALNGSTLAHELGHYFGLYHTHETSLGIELADGSNCSFTGDELCDTPADPRLGSGNVNDACEYTGIRRDPKGDRYAPDPNNIMSYSLKECRNYFSPEQQARIKFYQERFRNHLNPCVTTKQKIQPDNKLFRLFPNPSKDRIQFEFDSEFHLDGASLILQSIDGKLISNYNTVPGSIQIENLKQGVYLITILSDESVVARKLFMKI